jgi:hypothetical protein
MKPLSQDPCAIDWVLNNRDWLVNGFPNISLPQEVLPHQRPLAIKAGVGPVGTPLQTPEDMGSGFGTCT